MSCEWSNDSVCFHTEVCDAGQALSALCLLVTPEELICPSRKTDELLEKKGVGGGDSEHLGRSVLFCVAL